ncbi:unnamed protein product [Merluccius merluccius]
MFSKLFTETSAAAQPSFGAFAPGSWAARSHASGLGTKRAGLDQTSLAVVYAAFHLPESVARPVWTCHGKNIWATPWLKEAALEPGSRLHPPSRPPPLPADLHPSQQTSTPPSRPPPTQQTSIQAPGSNAGETTEEPAGGNVDS